MCYFGKGEVFSKYSLYKNDKDSEYSTNVENKPYVSCFYDSGPEYWWKE